MKKLLPILCAVAMTQTAAISSVAPDPRNLTVQEDPGTGLYGYLNIFLRFICRKRREIYGEG